MSDNTVYTRQVKQCWNDGYLAMATEKGVACGYEQYCKYQEHATTHIKCLRWNKKDITDILNSQFMPRIEERPAEKTDDDNKTT